MADQRCRTANCPNRQAGPKCPEHGGPVPELAATPEPEAAPAEPETVDDARPSRRLRLSTSTVDTETSSDSPAVE